MKNNIKSTQRGMMKWQSFQALENHSLYIQNAIIESQKITKPELSVDQIEEINYKLINYKGQKVKIKYFTNGFINQEDGYITQINKNNSFLEINTIKILFIELLDIIY